MSRVWPEGFSDFSVLVMFPPRRPQPLPRAVADALISVIPMNCTVRTPIGRTWEVRIQESRPGCVHFTSGWQDFSEANHAQACYSMIFSPRAGGMLDVRIYRPDGCETYAYAPPVGLISSVHCDLDDKSFRIRVRESHLTMNRIPFSKELYNTFLAGEHRKSGDVGVLIFEEKSWLVHLYENDNEYYMEGVFEDALFEYGLRVGNVLLFHLIETKCPVLELTILG